MAENLLGLDMKGPYRLISKDGKYLLSLNDELEKPGIYIWAVERTIDNVDEYWISYVGISDNMKRRQIEHIQSYLAGIYRVYGPDYLTEPKPEKIYDPGKGWAQFWQNREEILKAVTEQLARTKVFFVPRDGDRMLIESALSKTIRDEKTGKHYLDNSRRSTKQSSDVRYRLDPQPKIDKGFHGLQEGYIFGPNN